MQDNAIIEYTNKIAALYSRLSVAMRTGAVSNLAVL